MKDKYGVQIAEFEGHQGYISNQFIFDLACRKLNLTPEQLENIVGRYCKGKRKGQLKGRLIWTKCTVGGWKWEVSSSCYATGGCHKRGTNEGNTGYIVSPGITFDYKLVDSWTGDEIKYDKDNLEEEIISNHSTGCEAAYLMAE